MKKLLVFIVCMSLFIFGCSNNKKETTLQKINKEGKVVIGTDASFAPYEFMEDGKIVGYGPDVLAEIMKNWSVKAEQIDVPFTGILPGLDRKEI